VSPDVQAKLQTDVQIEQMRQQGNMRADEVKKDIERMIVATDARNAQLDRDANERAALIAERIQALDRVSEERLTHFRAMVEAEMAQQRESYAQLREQFKAAMQERLVLLEASISSQLQTFLAPPEKPSEPSEASAAVKESFAELQEKMAAQEARNQEFHAQLVAALGTVGKLVRAPRTAEYVRDPATGKALSARSRIIEEEEQP
jgi:hypothetical protein